MDINFLLTVALVAVTIFFGVWTFTHAFEWFAYQWWRARINAIERSSHRVEREDLVQSRATELQAQQYQQQLLARGRSLLENGGGQPLSYKDVVNLYGSLERLERVLGRCAERCFDTLTGVVGVYGNDRAAYDLADQDPERIRAQNDVRAVVLAGIEQLEGVTNLGRVDPGLMLWKKNLQNISSRTCVCCPVVSQPESYMDSCPVMRMTKRGRSRKIHGETAVEDDR